MRIIIKKGEKMKRKKFTDQEKKLLLKNENVIEVRETNVKYSPKFKLKAVQEYYAGNTPQTIFLNAGFDINLLGKKNPERSISRWRNIYKKLGEQGLLNEQRGQRKGGGRPRTKELSLEEKIKYLEAENEFLKKLKALEGGVV